MSADMTSIANISEIWSKLVTSRLTCPQVFDRTKKSDLDSLREQVSLLKSCSHKLHQILDIPELSLGCFITRLVNFHSYPNIRIGLHSKIELPQQTLTAYQKFSSGLPLITISCCIKIFSSMIHIIAGLVPHEAFLRPVNDGVLSRVLHFHRKSSHDSGWQLSFLFITLSDPS